MSSYLRIQGRILGAAYLATASAILLAAACADQAALSRAGVRMGRAVSRTVSQWTPSMPRLLNYAAPRPGGPVRLTLAAPPTPKARLTASLATAPVIPLAIPGLPTPGAPVPPARDAAATARLEARLTPALRRSFALFLYVSKARVGPLAQRLFVFRKTGDGALELMHDWPASTGREKRETTPAGRAVFTDTPAGIYQLDPDRMYAHYHSHAWDRSMPYAMFFGWVRHGRKTGLAIHAATGADIALLGRRASAGCVHVSVEHARELFALVRAQYRGPVPRFAFDPQTRTTSNKGVLMRDGHGHPVMMPGYRVLVVIDDSGGTIRDAGAPPTPGAPA